jgi:hypothetical protein
VGKMHSSHWHQQYGRRVLRRNRRSWKRRRQRVFTRTMTQRHTVKIIDFRKLPEGKLAICGQCCGDPMHISWHTMGPKVLIDESKRAASTQTFVDRMANEHEIALQAEPILKALLGTNTAIAITPGVTTVVQTIPPADTPATTA